ncbi:MAG: class II aldolase/adducin family protein [Terriglobales bacterium]
MAVDVESQAGQDILRIGQFLHQKSLVAASDGNISVRLPGGRILATPTSMSKGMMSEADLVVTDLEGRQLAGTRHPSSEMAMHLLIYQLRPEVHGVVHAHPPAATGFAAAGIPLNQALLAEVVLALGCIPLAAYGTTGTPELSATLRPLIPHYDAILMANHGVVTYGESVWKAYFKMETVEHFARIALVTHLLGRQNLLGQEEVDKLVLARGRYEGVTSAAALSPSCPVTRDDGMAASPGAASPRLPPTLPNGKRRW